VEREEGSGKIQKDPELLCFDCFKLRHFFWISHPYQKSYMIYRMWESCQCDPPFHKYDVQSWHRCAKTPILSLPYPTVINTTKPRKGGKKQRKGGVGVIWPIRAQPASTQSVPFPLVDKMIKEGFSQLQLLLFKIYQNRSVVWQWSFSRELTMIQYCPSNPSTKPILSKDKTIVGSSIRFRRSTDLRRSYHCSIYGLDPCRNVNILQCRFVSCPFWR
jgi:hypothetical protein